MFAKENFWLGLKGGLLDIKHVANMGMAIWLFGYLTLRQTHVNEAGEGVVNYGHPLTLDRISQDMRGVPKGTIRRWLAQLRRHAYVRTEEHSNKGLTFWIAKAKSKTKAPRIAIAKSVGTSVDNSRAEMNASLGDSRSTPSYGRVNSRVDLSERDFSTTSQATELQGVAIFSKTPIPKVFSSKNPSKEAEEKASAAFSEIGFDEPFGQKSFQEIWLRRFYESKGHEWLTPVMEATIQECQRKNIGVPPQFYAAKHDLETRENSEARQRLKKTLL